MELNNIFWQNMIKSFDAEYININTIKGFSGLEHPLLALGVDDINKRLIVVSSEYNARSAAMLQVDLNQLHKKYNVLVVRPYLINFTIIIDQFINLIGEKKLQRNELLGLISDKEYWEKNLTVLLDKYAMAVKISPISWSYKITQIIDQLLSFDLTNSVTSNNDDAGKSIVDLTKILPDNPIYDDINFGICPLPLYEFTTEEIGMLLQDDFLEESKEILLKYNVLQYFHPPIDQLALGLVDHHSCNKNELIDKINYAPKQGHPFGANEIIQENLPILSIIEALKDRKYLVEGEIGYELTEASNSLRSTIKFKPREGLISKIINRFSVNVDLKDIVNMFKQTT